MSQLLLLSTFLLLIKAPTRGRTTGQLGPAAAMLLQLPGSVIVFNMLRTCWWVLRTQELVLLLLLLLLRRKPTSSKTNIRGVVEIDGVGRSREKGMQTTATMEEPYTA